MSANDQIEDLQVIFEITDGGTGTVAIEIIKKYRKALYDILDELGVPGEGYPAPVGNAVQIAREAIAKAEGE
jgi:hypothetical protein